MITKNLSIHDARKQTFGDFYDSGFTLIKLEEEPITTDWRTPDMDSEDGDIKKFHNQSCEPGRPRRPLELHRASQLPPRVLWAYPCRAEISCRQR